MVLDREFFGTLTATLIPPYLAITTNLLEGMLAVGSGVRSVSLAYAEQGSRAQDVAAVQVMGRLGRELLGCGGAVRVATVFHQFMGAFPADRDEAEALIRESARTAAFAGAVRGSRPYASAWLSSRAASRASRSSQAPTSASVPARRVRSSRLCGTAG